MKHDHCTSSYLYTTLMVTMKPEYFPMLDEIFSNKRKLKGFATALEKIGCDNPDYKHTNAPDQLLYVDVPTDATQETVDKLEIYLDQLAN